MDFLAAEPATEAEEAAEPAEPATPEDLLVHLAGRLQSDGGMDGKDDFARAVHSLVALLVFRSQGHTPTSGAFRVHVQKLERFLEAEPFPSLEARDRERVRQVLEWSRTAFVPGEALECARLEPTEAWRRIQALAGVAS